MTWHQFIEAEFLEMEFFKSPGPFTVDDIKRFAYYAFVHKAKRPNGCGDALQLRYMLQDLSLMIGSHKKKCDYGLFKQALIDEGLTLKSYDYVDLFNVSRRDYMNLYKIIYTRKR